MRFVAKNILLKTVLCFGITFPLRAEGVPAVTLGGGMDSACYPYELPPELLGNFTVCAFVRPEARTLDNLPADPLDSEMFHDDQVFDGIIFTLFHNNTLTEAIFQGSKLMVSHHETTYMFDGHFPAHSWRRFCLHFDSHKKEVCAMPSFFLLQNIK
ncbi:hypothetical protein SK128_024080 [Halocaridina rubra]|uniref:Secreted protein n=1 Tax=Halocaridina rubra TaxID=373956 RepID=A0AAN8WEM1_HALRR